MNASTDGKPGGAAGGRRRFNVKRLDAGPSRAATHFQFDAIDGRLIPFDLRLDATVRQIPDEPVYPLARRGFLGEHPEADTLHASPNQKTASDDHGVKVYVPIK
jgi:hypothetical protein